MLQISTKLLQTSLCHFTQSPLPVRSLTTSLRCSDCSGVLHRSRAVSEMFKSSMRGVSGITATQKNMEVAQTCFQGDNKTVNNKKVASTSVAIQKVSAAPTTNVKV